MQVTLVMQVMQVSLAHLWVDFRVIFFVLFLCSIIIFNCCAVFDKDRSGFASSSEIKAVMANLGVHFTDDEITEMMLEVGPKDLSVEPSSSGGCQWRQPGGLWRVQGYDDCEIKDQSWKQILYFQKHYLQYINNKYLHNIVFPIWHCASTIYMTFFLLLL